MYTNTFKRQAKEINSSIQRKSVMYFAETLHNVEM